MTNPPVRLRPYLHDEPVVYALVAPSYDAETILATVREPEGMTVIITQEEADDDGLLYEFVGAWITLGVHTDLEAVGVTAAVSRVLADADIACNVIAGFHHDHVVVPYDRRHDAVSLIDGLQLHLERE